MIIDRILQVVSYKGISKRKFYLQTGLSNGFLDKNRDLGASKVEKILRTYPEINPVWLLLGEGEMLVKDNKIKQIPLQNELSDKTPKNVDVKDMEHLRTKIILLEQSIKDKDKLIAILERNQR